MVRHGILYHEMLCYVALRCVIMWYGKVRRVAWRGDVSCCVALCCGMV